MEKQISIIIPTYNMEKYLAKCLDSLIIPEFDEVEVLVINDGSKDRSSEIAHEYEKRFPNSIRVIDKENGNYGSCINTALPLANGRYVKILDADDSFDTLAFGKFVKLLKNTDADLVLTKCQCVDEESNKLNISGYSRSSFEMNHLYDMDHSKLPKILMHWVSYRKDVFSRFRYIQPEGISYTDDIWAYIPSIFCKTMIAFDIVLYLYLIGRPGQTVDTSKLQKSLPHLIGVAKSMAEYHSILKENSEYNDLAFKRAVGLISIIYYKILRYQNSQNMKLIEDFDVYLSKEHPEIFEGIGALKLHKILNYKFFNELRKSGYNSNFHIPFHINFLYKNILRFENRFSRK